MIKRSPRGWLEVIDQNDRNPLHFACASNALVSLDIAAVLNEAHHESFVIPDKQGITPSQFLPEVTPQKNDRGILLLHRHAKYSEGFTVISLHPLFNAYPKSIHEQDNHGMLPFHHACLNQESSVDIMMSLLQFHPESIALVGGVETNNALNRLNFTAEN